MPLSNWKAELREIEAIIREYQARARSLRKAIKTAEKKD